MADTTTSYRRHSYRRVCDVCGNLRQIEEMHKQDDLWVCTYDAGERVRTQLDRANARQLGPSIKPVPHPKPWDNYYPNLLETDDAAVFNFLSQQVAARCRYELVQSGAAVDTSLGKGVEALSWAARYFYDLIQEGARELLIPRAKELLVTIADYLLTRQYGSPTGISTSSTRANDAFFGAFLEPGGSTLITANTSTSGLALLYAYRVHGNSRYLVGARSAASYLRNVQACGSHGTNFTSSDAAGLARLYTGAVCSEVSTAVVLLPDPPFFNKFFTNSLFYPGDLLCLEFWNELKLTDGDQSVGLTAVAAGFDSIPAQLLSESIADMRTCWETGIQETTGTVVNGLSSTTPREYFNAFPAAKPQFASSAGTGMWEYLDGDSVNGTQITSQNVALAVSSLYNYESASAQITTISDWLRTFTSNPAFETGDNVSTSELARATTGTYDPTISIATVLTVRDSANAYAAIKTNGSSLYDWGAFGLLSRLWASRNKASFRQSRLFPLNTNLRFLDGSATDIPTDRIILRGMCGLTFQTAFGIDTTAPGPTAQNMGSSSPDVSTPPMTSLWLWLEADEGLTKDEFNFISAWADKSGNDHGPTQGAVSGAQYIAVGIDGLPSVQFSGLNGLENIVDNIPLGARTIMIVAQPRLSGGGSLITFRRGPAPRDWVAYMWIFGGVQYTWSDGISNIAAVGAPVDYSGSPRIFEHVQSASNTLTVRVDGSALTMTGSATASENSDPGFTLGGRAIGSYLQGWDGMMRTVMVWTRNLSITEATRARGYAATITPSLPAVAAVSTPVVNDAVRAAQYGRSFRESRQ